MLSKVILDHMVSMHEKVVFNTATGKITKTSTPDEAAGHFVEYPETGVWGLFYSGDSYYFFHNTNLYDLDCGGYQIDVEIISDKEAKFSFSKEGVILEKLQYEREHEDDWRDEDELDIFQYVKELYNNRMSRDLSN